MCMHVRLILCDTIRGHIYICYIMRARLEPSASVHALTHTHARAQTFAGYMCLSCRGSDNNHTRLANRSSSTALFPPLPLAISLSVVPARVLASLPCRRRPDGGLRASENRCNGFARAQRTHTHTQTLACVCVLLVGIIEC